MKIAIVADGDTVNCFKLAGLECAYSVKNAEEGEEQILELLESSDFAVIITTNLIANRIRDTINEINLEREYPVVISIPEVEGSSLQGSDPITELIKRKTGIELKIQSDSKEMSEGMSQSV
ncbi:MAG: V-type ATP synthase subunit F [Thermoproteota archaeon]